MPILGGQGPQYPFTSGNPGGVDGLLDNTPIPPTLPDARSRLVTQLYPDTSTLIDDFTTQDTGKWSGYGANVVWNGARGTVDIAVTSSYFNLTSTQRYRLIGSSVYGKIYSPPPIVADNSSEMHLQVVITPGVAYVGISWVESGAIPRVYMREVTGGVVSDTQVTMDPSTGYMRIRESSGTLYWETSPDTVTWTIQRSKATTNDWSNASVVISAGYWGTVTGAGTGSWDSVNSISPSWLPRSFVRARRAVPVRQGRPVGGVIPLPAASLPAPDFVSQRSARGRTPRTPRNRLSAAPRVPLTAQERVPGPLARRRPVAVPLRLRAPVGPVPTQLAPVAPTWVPAMTRGLRLIARTVRRADIASPVSTQQVIVNPPITATVFGRLRMVGRIQPRGKVDNPIPAQQVTVTNPPITATVFGRLRMVGRIQPRPKVSNPTSTQAVVTNPPITATVFGRLRIVGRIRTAGKVSSPVALQHHAPTPRAFGRLRIVGRIQPRAKVSNPVPAQAATVTNPPITATVFGRLRTVGRVRPRTKVSNPVPAQAATVANPPVTATVFGRLRIVGRVRPPAKVSNPVPTQQAATPNPVITATVFGRLRIVGRVRPRTKVSSPVPVQAVVTNPSITATVFGRLRTVGRVRPPARTVTPVPLQSPIPNPVFRRLRTVGRTNRVPRASKPIPPQANPLYPIRPSVGGLSGLRRVWLKVRRKNAYPVPPQITTLQGPLTITDSFGGVEADRGSGTVIGGTYGSSSSATVSKGSRGGFSADPDFDNVAPSYDSDSDSL